MSNITINTTNQAGPSFGTDRENINSTADFGQLASAGHTYALLGCEVQESKVRELHTEWLRLIRKSLSVAIQLGRILVELKAELKKAIPKRPWEPYVRIHLGIHPRTASNYMRLSLNASTINGIGELLQSETISELGIREGLNLLTEVKKASKITTDQEHPEHPKHAPSARGSSAMSEADEQTTLPLVDGSRINMRTIHWSDGIIPRSKIESWLTEVSPEPDNPKKRRIEARRQRAVIFIAAGINHACGNSEPTAASELVESSFEIIRAMLRMSPPTGNTTI